MGFSLSASFVCSTCLFPIGAHFLSSFFKFYFPLFKLIVPSIEVKLKQLFWTSPSSCCLHIRPIFILTVVMCLCVCHVQCHHVGYLVCHPVSVFTWSIHWRKTYATVPNDKDIGIVLRFSSHPSSYIYNLINLILHIKFVHFLVFILWSI